jgi:hypothetical protein
MVLLPAIILVTLPLALITEVDGRFSQVLLDLWRHGLDSGRFTQDEFVWALRVDLGWYIAFWLLAVAGASASSVTIEREEDTWVSLTSTPLTGWQIVRAKVLGAIWNQRGFAAALGLLWLLGLVTGAVHPVGLLASVAVTAVLTWFVAALGVYASVRAQSTSRALAATLVALCLFNGYPAILGLYFLGALGWESSFSVLGIMPRLAIGPVVTPWFVGESWRLATTAGLWFIPSGLLLAFGLWLLAIYAGAATALTSRVVNQFDRWLDRPRASGTAELAQECPAKRVIPLD